MNQSRIKVFVPSIILSSFYIPSIYEIQLNEGSMPKKYLGKRNDEEGILFWSIKVVSLIHLSRHPNTFKLGQIVLIRDQWRKIYLGIRDYVEKFEILIHLSITSFDENITYSSWKHDKKHFWFSFKLFDWPSLIQIKSKIW